MHEKLNSNVSFNDPVTQDKPQTSSVVHVRNIFFSYHHTELSVHLLMDERLTKTAALQLSQRRPHRATSLS